MLWICVLRKLMEWIWILGVFPKYLFDFVISVLHLNLNLLNYSDQYLQDFVIYCDFFVDLIFSRVWYYLTRFFRSTMEFLELNSAKPLSRAKSIWSSKIKRCNVEVAIQLQLLLVDIASSLTRRKFNGSKHISLYNLPTDQRQL